MFDIKITMKRSLERRNYNREQNRRRAEERKQRDQLERERSSTTPCMGLSDNDGW